MYAETRLLPYKYSKYYIYNCEVSAKWLDQRDEAARAIVWARLEGLYMTRLLKLGFKWMT